MDATKLEVGATGVLLNKKYLSLKIKKLF